MPRAVRVQTDYKGVSYVEKSDERIFYITYRRPESRKLYEEKVGRKSQGWTVARAAAERARRMNGQAQTNEEKRQANKLAKLAESEKPTIDRLWQFYLESKGDSLKGLTTDKNRYELHIRSTFGKKTPNELAPLDIDRLRLNLLKEHSSKTVSNVLELLRRIVNFGIRKKLCPALDWTIQLPKADSDSERIEILSDEQFRELHKVWAS